MKKMLGMDYGDINSLYNRKAMIEYINFKLAALGQPIYENSAKESGYLAIASEFLLDYQEKSRLLADHLCPADRVIQDFLDSYFQDTKNIHLPANTFILDQWGLARELSICPHKNKYKNEHLSSYRIQQGVLHNPKSDRRTTKGSFHVAEGGLPIPSDKKAVPKEAVAKLLFHAFNPPQELLELPFTTGQSEQAKTFVSLLLKPIICPEVPGKILQKNMEIRAFAPGCLVSNLDFLESIFGNAGNPYHLHNDSRFDIDHFSGHTGCIVLAPHLTQITKKELGLPHIDNATDRQKRDGMCYKEADEFYNEGSAFKLTVRDERGVIVTLLADNYYGYSKKEVKTQISYAANLYGLVEEEHAGGVIAFPRENIGDYFWGKKVQEHYPNTFGDLDKLIGEKIAIQPGNYAFDKQYPNIIYIPENAEIDMYKEKLFWEFNRERIELPLKPEMHYIHPSGHRIMMEKHPAAPTWRLITTLPFPIFCHKPCTVSGGGKSEISKSILNSVIYGTLHVNSIEEDLDYVECVLAKDLSERWQVPPTKEETSRPILSNLRTLGSVIKLLTPNPEYTDAFNDFLKEIPPHVKALLFFIKRFYKPEWGNNWREHFTVDKINNRPGNQLMFNDRKIIASFLRVGFETGTSWRLHKLRTDFHAAFKIQMEDDITASVTLPVEEGKKRNRSQKFTANCENRFFQRPDEAIHRGFDKQAEADMSGHNLFISNYEPLTPANAKEMMEHAIEFNEYTKPIQQLVSDNAKAPEDSYFITPSHPRLVNGKPSQNPRYLQVRPDFTNPIDYYLAEIMTRLGKNIPAAKPVLWSVEAVLPGRRNNPPEYDKGIRPLSVYGPIHYQELPELFMDFISSLTGKSPSTTGAGSEGALTKGPFNALCPITDLNNALLSYILTGYQGFSTAAGYIGTNYRFDHDISILIPELWCRLQQDKFDAKMLIVIGALEKLEDYEYKGQKILASRLGYRITETFVANYLGKIFDEPLAVFTPEMLKPELDNPAVFADGINNIVEAQKKAALEFFEDGSVKAAIPPLKALLHIMAYGQYEGKDINNPQIREMFSYKRVIEEPWYRERLLNKQKKEIAMWQKHIFYLKAFLSDVKNQEAALRLQLDEKLLTAEKRCAYAQSDDYLQSLFGTIGADLLFTDK